MDVFQLRQFLHKLNSFRASIRFWKLYHVSPFLSAVATAAQCQHFPGQYVFVRSSGFSSRKFGLENCLCVYRSGVEAAEVTLWDSLNSPYCSWNHKLNIFWPLRHSMCISSDGRTPIMDAAAALAQSLWWESCSVCLNGWSCACPACVGINTGQRRTGVDCVYYPG